MNIVKSVHGSYNEVNRNIQILEKEGIINSYRMGYSRIISLNTKNPLTINVIKAIILLDDIIVYEYLFRKNPVKKSNENFSSCTNL